MAGKLNWSKTNVDRRMRDNGFEVHDDYQPKPHDGTVPLAKQSPASKARRLVSSKTKGRLDKKLQQLRCRENYIREVKKALTKGQEPPQPFKKLASEVKKQIGAASSIQAWVKEQPEFSEALKIEADLTKQDSNKSTKQWRASLTRDVSRIEHDLRELEKRRRALRADLESKKKALKALQ
ncbi:MAG: hypothetical protein CML60_04940 [Rhodobacteraceae bacterium]|nr:hypothetical protein [Paracoccaceae bacterium]